MCRRFFVSVKPLAGGRFVLQTNVATTSVDGKCFADYYETGSLQDLAGMIAAKRESRLTRENRPVGVRVLHQPAEGTGATRALDFEDVEALLRHAELEPDQQRALGSPVLRCRPFGRQIEISHNRDDRDGDHSSVGHARQSPDIRGFSSGRNCLHS